jgi:hypothetical protein
VTIGKIRVDPESAPSADSKGVQVEAQPGHIGGAGTFGQHDSIASSNDGAEILKNESSRERVHPTKMV